MNKKFFIFIFLLTLSFECNSLLADTEAQLESQQPCTKFFSSTPSQNVINQSKATRTDVVFYVDTVVNMKRNSYKDSDDYYAHLVIDQMLKDLISVYQQKILELLSSNPYVKYIHYPTNNNPIIPSYYMNDFTQRPEPIFQENIDYHLFRIRYEPEKKVIWDEELSLLRYLERYFRQQFGENEIKNYIQRSLLDLIEDKLSENPSEDSTSQYDFKHSKKEKALLRSKPEFTATINYVFDIKNVYLEILLQHIITYHILSNENYNLDPNLKKNMLDHVIYMDLLDNPVLIKDFFYDIINNVRFLNTNRSYYIELAKDEFITNKIQFLNKIYPNIFVNKTNLPTNLEQYLLEQDMMFLMKYIKYSSKQDLMSEVINTTLKTTEEKDDFDLFRTFSDKIHDDIFNLKQIFYIGSFPISLDTLVNALANNSTVSLSNKDIVDLILGLYGTNVQTLGIDYDYAVEKFGLKYNEKDIGNNQPLYSSINLDYMHEFYQILYYIVNTDPDFCKKLGLKNKSIVFSFNETLLEKIILY